MRMGFLILTTALGLGLLALWPWSWFRGCSLGLPWERNATLAASNGELVYWSSDVGEASRWETFDTRKEPMTGEWIATEMGKPFAFRFGPFAWGRFWGGGPVAIAHTVVVVPVWFPAALCLVPLVWRVVRRRRTGRGFPVVSTD